MMCICETVYGNWIVCESIYAGGTFYDADTLEEALDWCKEHGVDIDPEDGIRTFDE